MNRCIAFLVVIILMGATGCVAPDRDAGNPLTPVGTYLASTPIPVQNTIPAVALPTEVPTLPAMVTVTPSPAITPEKTPAQVSESALKARIQDAKNKLDMLKDSDKADTVIKPATPPLYCEIKESKELGYLIDVNTGDMAFVKGDYGSIALNLFRQNMTLGDTYIILHTHARNWFTCNGSGTIGLNIFSLADLAAASNLTEQGYHIQKVIAVSDEMYEIYPKTRDNWKTMTEVYSAAGHIEQRTELTFHMDYYDPDTGKKTVYYDVDNLMPLLTRELDYTYVVNNVVLT
ncbi:MAG: hypothetical protein WC620_04525 [Methanoregula sp.]|jgi:hypothetical protein